MEFLDLTGLQAIASQMAVKRGVATITQVTLPKSWTFGFIRPRVSCRIYLGSSTSYFSASTSHIYILTRCASTFNVFQLTAYEDTSVHYSASLTFVGNYTNGDYMHITNTSGTTVLQLADYSFR